VELPEDARPIRVGTYQGKVTRRCGVRQQRTASPRFGHPPDIAKALPSCAIAFLGKSVDASRKLSPRRRKIRNLLRISQSF
jgi:hypothetical protein